MMMNTEEKEYFQTTLEEYYTAIRYNKLVLKTLNTDDGKRVLTDISLLEKEISLVVKILESLGYRDVINNAKSGGNKKGNEYYNTDIVLEIDATRGRKPLDSKDYKNMKIERV